MVKLVESWGGLGLVGRPGEKVAEAGRLDSLVDQMAGCARGSGQHKFDEEM